MPRHARLRARLGLPGSDAEVSLVEGLRDAVSDPGLASRVREAWTDSYNTVGLVGLAVMALVLLVTLRTLPTDEAPRAAPTSREPVARHTSAS